MSKKFNKIAVLLINNDNDINTDSDSDIENHLIEIFLEQFAVINLCNSSISNPEFNFCDYDNNGNVNYYD